MRLGRKKVSALALLLIFSFLVLSSPYSFPQDPESSAAQKLQQAELSEEIHPAPADIKQKIGLLVFLGWMWLSILVLIYFLRLKIQEVDRLHELGYFSPPKE